MPVYFIRAADGTGPVKIGYTAGQPEKRLSQIQAMSPVLLQLLHVTEGDTQLERELHQRFAEARLHGEWFAPVEGLLSFMVNLMSQAATVTISQPEPEPETSKKVDGYPEWHDLPDELTCAQVSKLLGRNRGLVLYDMANQKIPNSYRKEKRKGEWHIRKSDLARYITRRAAVSGASGAR